MDKYERYKDVPHFDLVKENKTIEIPSIFLFEGGCLELFPFLQACKEYNCTVCFANEDLTVIPNSGTATNMLLSIYATIAENPKFANDYIRYLGAKSFTPEKLKFSKE